MPTARVASVERTSPARSGKRSKSKDKEIHAVTAHHNPLQKHLLDDNEALWGDVEQGDDSNNKKVGYGDSSSERGDVQVRE